MSCFQTGSPGTKHLGFHLHSSHNQSHHETRRRGCSTDQCLMKQANCCRKYELLGLNRTDFVCNQNMQPENRSCSIYDLYQKRKEIMACLKQRSFLPYTHPRANFLVMQPDRMRNCSSQ